MNPRSTERDLLRNYSREEIAIHEDNVGGSPAPDKPDYVCIGKRGELAGKAIMALQNVLTYLDSIDGDDMSAAVVFRIRAEIRKGLS